MGWMAEGMGALRAPGVFSKTFNAEDAEETFNAESAEEFFFSGLVKLPGLTPSEALGLREVAFVVLAFFCATSALIVCFCLSVLAMAPASQALPGDLAAGRLLFHSRAPSSPAIWSRVRRVSAEKS